MRILQHQPIERSSIHAVSKVISRGGAQSMNYIRHITLFYAMLKKDQALTSAHVSLYLALFQCWNVNRFQNPILAHRENIMQLCKIGSKNTYHKCLKELHESRYIYCQPGLNKFQPLKISLINLEKKGVGNHVTQLDFFSQVEPSTAPKNDRVTVPDSVHHTVPNMGHGKVKCDTVPVPNMIPGKVKIGTVPVPYMGHLYKPNINKLNSVCNTPTEIFLKNMLVKKVEKQETQDAGPAPKQSQKTDPAPPTLPEVERFFQEENYPAAEAKKFFLYNQGKAWMIAPGFRIQDWQSLAHKWMLNDTSIERQEHHGSAATHQVNQQKNYGEPL